MRADVLAILHADPTKVWTSSEVGRAVGRRQHVVDRELRRLAEHQLVRVAGGDRKRQYSAQVGDPVGRELARFVRQTRGRIPVIRSALQRLRSPLVAWAVSSRITNRSPAYAGPRPDGLDLIVLTAAPKSLVRIQLAGVIGDDATAHCMSVREWLARLEKGDLFARRARRARKQWIVGSWEELVQKERTQIDAARTLKTALTNWHEDLSDEWDEDWDPASGQVSGQP